MIGSSDAAGRLDDVPFGSDAAKALFGLDPAVAYFNHGGFGVTPRAVAAGQVRWRERIEADPTTFFSPLGLAPLLRAGADRVAGRFGGQGGEWGFVPNVTAGLNAVIQAVDLRPGDEILLTDHGYNAVRQAALHWTSRVGASVATASLPWPAVDADAVVAAIARAIGPRTRLVIVDHVTSPTSLALPVERIAALCRDAGVPLVVDGAHAPGQIEPLDAPAIGADIYVGNLHKWAWVPRGCGVLWASAAWRARLHPTVISHGYGQGFAAEFDWQGTADPTPALCVGAAFDFADWWGRERIDAWNRALLDEAVAHLASALGVNGAPSATLLAPMMATLPLPTDASGVDAALALRRRLLERHRLLAQIVPFRDRLWLRICAAPYLGRADVERLAAALRECLA